jgi:putative membrane protein
MRGSIIPRIWGQLLLMLILSIVAAIFTQHRPDLLGTLTEIPVTLVGLSLSTLMILRTNAFYKRWLERRQLWGQLAIVSRCFVRETSGFAESERSCLLLGLCTFVGGIAARLRDQDELKAITRWAPDADRFPPASPTDAILQQVGKTCFKLMTQGDIHPVHYRVLETHLSKLSNIQSSLVQIKGPISGSPYTTILRNLVYLYCVLIPFALCPPLGWWTVVLTPIISYPFLRLDALRGELGDPFGNAPNSLSLETMIHDIERELLTALGYKRLPAPVFTSGSALTQNEVALPIASNHL